MAAPAVAPVPFPPPRPAPAFTALPQSVPFPPPRPRNADGPGEPPPAPAQAAPPVPAAPAGPAPAAADPAELAACQGRLTAARADFHPLPPILGDGGCGATDAVQLDAVAAEDGSRIVLNPAAVLRCGMAEAIVNWLGQDLVPLTRGAGLNVTGLAVAGSYECRGRNRIIGARMSQHGLANALDVRALGLAHGGSFGLTDPTTDKGLRERLLGSACARFTTVLGPGSDGAHEDHIHLDVAQRRGGYRICQWDVR